MSLQFLELEAGVLRMSWNPYQCSNENAFDQNFWNCGWLLTQLKQLLAQAGERQSHIWTGIQCVKQHKSAPFLTCLFYWWLFFMLKIGRVEKKKELDCSIYVFPSSPLPYVRISCLSPLPKGLPHNCVIPCNSPFPQPFQRFFCLSASAVLGCGYCRVSEFLPHGRALHLLHSLDPEQ